MASKPNTAAFNVAAKLLVEADLIRCSQAPCRPPTHKRSSHEPSIADSGFYSSSEVNSSTSVIPEPCRATQEMVHLSRDLLLFYSDEKISSGDPPVDLQAEGGDKPMSRILGTFLSSSGTKNSNAWNMGSLVASHVLSSLPKDRADDSCESEMDMEAYLSLILSITVASDASTVYLLRARKLCKHRQGDVPKHIHRLQVSLSNSITFPVTHTSPSREEQPHTPNNLKRQHRRSVRSISSISSSWFSTLSTPSSKGSTVPPAVLKHPEPVGSFAVTCPARNSLRYVMSQSARPWGIPSLWLLKTSSPSKPPLDATAGHDLPTISRTPSTRSVTETLDSPEGPLTPDLVSSPISFEANWKEAPGEEATSSLLSPQQPLSKLNPILAKVERTSQFRTITECSACQKVGLDYPKCPRCEEMWCSRECRLQGGKRHACKRT